MAHQQRLIAPKEAASELLLGTAEMDVGSWSGLDEFGPVRAPVCSSLQTLRQRGGPPNQREATLDFQRKVRDKRSGGSTANKFRVNLMRSSFAAPSQKQKDNRSFFPIVTNLLSSSHD